MEMADGDRFTPEQAEALSALRDGRNVFLSGNAGTGKSYVLNAFISDLKARNVDFLALAPTGIAALNLTDGSTIHLALQLVEAFLGCIIRLVHRVPPFAAALSRFEKLRSVSHE